MPNASARRPFVNLLVAILLLLSQQAALAHAISHLGEFSGPRVHATHTEVSNQSGPDTQSDFCPECEAFAQVATATCGSGFQVVVAPQVICAVAQRITDRRSSTFLSFQARAPPATL